MNKETKKLEDWARRFHELYESLAPQFGYETREDTKVFDPKSNNGKLMVTVCNQLLAQRDAEIVDFVKETKIPLDIHKNGCLLTKSEKGYNNACEIIIKRITNKV